MRSLPRASDAPVVSGGSIFSWGYKFKYTGRTEREVLEEVGPLRKEEPPIQRCQTTCLRRKASSVPATPSTPSQDLVEIREQFLLSLFLYRNFTYCHFLLWTLNEREKEKHAFQGKLIESLLESERGINRRGEISDGNSSSSAIKKKKTRN